VWGAALCTFHDDRSGSRAWHDDWWSSAVTPRECPQRRRLGD
jgi:hypothetical protein